MKAKISTSFTKGFSRALNLAGTKTWPKLPNSKKADYKAIRSDWENVGRSIARETGNYKKHQIDWTKPE